MTGEKNRLFQALVKSARPMEKPGIPIFCPIHRFQYKIREIKEKTRQLKFEDR